MTYKVQYIFTTEEKLSTIDIVDGQVIALMDEGKSNLYYDVGGERRCVSSDSVKDLGHISDLSSLDDIIDSGVYRFTGILDDHQCRLLVIKDIDNVSQYYTTSGESTIYLRHGSYEDRFRRWIVWDPWTEVANSTNFLSKTNMTSYTPTSDYHPATKKYVDDICGDIESILNQINNGGTT